MQCHECGNVIDTKEKNGVPTYDDDGTTILFYWCVKCNAEIEREEAKRKIKYEAEEKKEREVKLVQERTCDECQTLYTGRAYRCKGTCHKHYCKSCVPVHEYDEDKDEFRYCHECENMYGRGP